MDASAGISIGSRRGLGKVKHIDTCYLWVQEIVDQGRIRLKKVNTQDMLADLMTKPLDGQTAAKLLGRMGYCDLEVVIMAFVECSMWQIKQLRRVAIFGCEAQAESLLIP
eukprot:s2440_g17.t1